MITGRSLVFLTCFCACENAPVSQCARQIQAFCFLVGKCFSTWSILDICVVSQGQSFPKQNCHQCISFAHTAGMMKNDWGCTSWDQAVMFCDVVKDAQSSSIWKRMKTYMRKHPDEDREQRWKYLVRNKKGRAYYKHLTQSVNSAENVLQAPPDSKKKHGWAKEQKRIAAAAWRKAGP